MITNIPRGMSQDNRAHPFFIILRRYSEQEEMETKTMVKQFLIALFLPFICSLPLVIFAWGRFFGISFTAMWLFHATHAYWELRKILANTTFPKVNHMIYGDQYSASPLNYEEVINLIGTVNLNLGRISTFMASLKSTALCQFVAIVIFAGLNLVKVIISL